MLYIAKAHWWTENMASVKILNDRKIHHFVHPFLFSSLFSEMFWLFSQSYFLTILHDQSRYGAPLNKARDSHAMDSKRATSSSPTNSVVFIKFFFFFYYDKKKRSLKRLWHHVTDSDTHIKSLLSTKDNDKKKYIPFILSISILCPFSPTEHQNLSKRRSTGTTERSRTSKKDNPSIFRLEWKRIYIIVEIIEKFVLVAKVWVSYRYGNDIKHNTYIFCNNIFFKQKWHGLPLVILRFLGIYWATILI